MYENPQKIEKIITIYRNLFKKIKTIKIYAHQYKTRFKRWKSIKMKGTLRPHRSAGLSDQWSKGFKGSPIGTSRPHRCAGLSDQWSTGFKGPPIGILRPHKSAKLPDKWSKRETYKNLLKSMKIDENRQKSIKCMKCIKINEIN